MVWRPAPREVCDVKVVTIGVGPAAPIVNDMVNTAFGALAHPVRRGIVERLASGRATVGQATSGLGVSKPAISRHLKVLEESGVVVRSIEGRTHRLGLDFAVLDEAVAWIEHQRAVWERMFDIVETYLEEQKRST